MSTRNLSSTESQTQKLHNLLIKAIFSVINSIRSKRKSTKINKVVNRKGKYHKIEWRKVTVLIVRIRSRTIRVKNLSKISLNMILVSVGGSVISSILMSFLSIIMVGSLFLYFPRRISGPFSILRANNSQNTEQNLSHNTSIGFSIIKN